MWLSNYKQRKEKEEEIRWLSGVRRVFKKEDITIRERE
jgi:hypothetical protein